MPPKSKAPKRKANGPPSEVNKSARTTTSGDAPTSKRKGLCRHPQLINSLFHVFFVADTNELTTDKNTEKGKYFHLYCKN
jgi:hypothetical protein